MKILVTGASSFVGYHLISRLSSEGSEIIGISRNRNENIKDLEKLSNFTYYQQDISTTRNLSQLTKGTDICYHLASISSERFCSQDPLQSVITNIVGTVNMLEAAKDNGTLFIFSSSGSVYPATSYPKKEEEAAFVPKFYGASKLTAENYCNIYNSKYDLDYVILRFSRIYGPRMQRNPIYDMCIGMARKQPINLYESPSSRYDFIYVDDVVDAFIKARDSAWKKKIVNISSNQAVELKKIYSMLTEISGRKVSIQLKVDKETIDVLNNNKARKLGWQSKVPLEKGLAETLQFFQEKI